MSPPPGRPGALQALIFDSQYDAYRGVIVYFRVMEGTIRTGMRVKMMASGARMRCWSAATSCPWAWSPAESDRRGGGLLHRLHQERKDTRVGTPSPGPTPRRRAPARLPPRPPMVYCGIYTEDGSKYPDLRDALEKLQLNDAALSFEPESSVALGFGFRCGFLGCSTWRSSRSGWSGVRPGSHHHPALGDLSDHQDRREVVHGGQPPQLP